MTDTEFLVPKAKCQKLNETGDVGLCTGFNDLPDVIIEHILSLLPAEEAVRTSVLSKRWKCLWPCMPKLVFCECSDDKTRSTRFMNIVDRAFILRDSSNIETFHLSLYPRDDIIRYRLRTWIVAAVRRKVQHLFIQCHVESVPSCVFICETLVNLRLSVSILKLPPSIRLSSLKVLSLFTVEFEHSTSLQELFSLPVLEELFLRECKWKDIKILNILAPKLWKLSIIKCSPQENTQDDFRLLIDGRSLKSFEYRGCLTYDVWISVTPLLGSATVYICYPYYYGSRDLLCYRVHILLMGLINSRYLSLSSVAIEALYYKNELFDAIPLFYNLTGLTLTGLKFNFDCQAPFAILTKFPCLERISFSQGIQLKRKRKNYSLILYPFPPCLVNLKKIEISDFNYVEREMIVLRELLAAAKFLKEIVIEGSYSFRNLQIELEKVVNDLKALLECSEDCTIVFKPTLSNADTIFIRKHC